jgi:putative serine protease PepD
VKTTNSSSAILGETMRRVAMKDVRILGRVAVVLAITFSLVALAGCGGSSSPATAPDLQSTFVSVIHEVGPSVVQIENPKGLGSGVVFDTKGHIVTNAHVVAGGGPLSVTLPNGKRYPATLVGTFAEDDLAIVRIDAPGLEPLALAPSSKLAVGDIVLAIGNPLGLRSSATQGIVSALGRTVSEPDGVAIPHAIQTSAAINPGNSGGALVDLSGRLVGIPTLTATDPQIGGEAAGIGFAIPSDTVHDIATQIVKDGKVVASHRAYLAVQVSDVVKGGGVYVGAVVSGGPAAKAGIRVGDVITSIAGTPTPAGADLQAVLAGLKPGQTVKVDVRQANGTRATLSVTLGEYPGTP